MELCLGSGADISTAQVEMYIIVIITYSIFSMAFSKRSITVVHNSSIEPTWEIVIYLDFQKTKQAL